MPAMLPSFFVEPRREALGNTFHPTAQTGDLGGDRFLLQRSHSFAGYIPHHLENFKASDVLTALKSGCCEGNATKNDIVIKSNVAIKDTTDVAIALHLPDTSDEGPQDCETVVVAVSPQCSPKRCDPPPQSCTASDSHLPSKSCPQEDGNPTNSDDLMMLGFKLLLQHAKSQSPPTLNTRTCFHAAGEPVFSFSEYISRFITYCDCSPSCYVVAFMYIDRIVQQFKELPFNNLTCHRLLLTSIVMAIKFNEEEVFPDKFYAAIGGLDVSEIVYLQRAFLELLNWKLNVDPVDYERYRAFMVQVALQAV